MTPMSDRLLRSAPLQLLLAGSSRLIARLDGLLQDATAWFAATLLLFALQAVLILTHWPWFDEWQALQIALQSPDLPAMMENLSYEGHPPLWYLVLRLAGEVMPPLWVLPAVALALAAVTQGLILFNSPFTRAERLLVALSQFVLFETLTVSRSFTLGASLIVLALAIWRKRLAWLPIALLPMCDFLFGVVSTALVALQWRRGGLWWPGIALWLAMGLAATWSVIPAPDVVPALETQSPLMALGVTLSNFGLLLLPFQWSDFAPAWNSRLPLLLLPFGWIGFLWFAWLQTARDQWNRLILFGLLGIALAFSMALYTLSFRHMVVIALMLIALSWIDRGNGAETPDRGMRAWLLAAAACGLFSAGVSFVQPFDRAHVAARIIEERGLQGERWLVIPLDAAQGIPALTGMELENPSLDCVQSFVPWTSRFKPASRAEMAAYLRDRVAREGQFYLVTHHDLAGFPSDLIEEIAFVKGGYDRHDFGLYLVGPDAPKLHRDMPQCTPGTLPMRALP